MNRRVVFVLVLAWNILVSVETKFYLELAKRSIDTLELITKTAQESGRHDERKIIVDLHVCEESNNMGPMYEVSCNSVLFLEEEKRIYAKANFNSVSNLLMPRKHHLKIEGEYYFVHLPQALAIGIEPENVDYYVESVLPYYGADRSNIKRILDRLIGPFIDPRDTSYMEDLSMFFSVNNYGYFVGRSIAAQQLFPRYVAMLRNVIGALAEKGNSGPQLRSRSLDRTQSSSSPKYNSKSSSRFSQLSWSRGSSKSRSPSKEKSPSRRWFQGLARTMTWPTHRRSKTLTSQKSDPKPTNIRSGSTNFPAPQSLQRPPPPSPFRSPIRSPSRSLSTEELLQAANLLAFKMFDPCFVFLRAELGPREGEPYCAVYCQFISATMKANGQNDHKQCENLTSGSCEHSVCKCVPGQGVRARVNMMQCNNALRLHIYQEVTGQSGYTSD